MSFWYRLSLICGFTPLIIGVVIFISWVATRADWLQIAGILNIILGLIFFVCGIFFLGVYRFKAKKQNHEGYLRKWALSLAVLVVNFPTAVVALYFASYIMGTCTVVVANNTAYEITDFTLSEGEEVYRFPKIGAYQKVEENFHFKYEGAVNYRFYLNGEVSEGIMFGYVTSGLGQKAVMVLSKDGEVRIENEI